MVLGFYGYNFIFGLAESSLWKLDGTRVGSYRDWFLDISASTDHAECGRVSCIEKESHDGSFLFKFCITYNISVIFSVYICLYN
ncbi:hypothetical protein Sjap_006815 [Stephania japonica]|uniref:Uncharacterized protein n=1 Tax=Stephania japonica TaxID=461633 RepID=A0AAP0K8Y5_9MAGN